MLEKLSKSSVSFMITTIDRSRHILSYSYLFEVFFFLRRWKVVGKATIHSYILTSKSTSILEKISSKVNHLIMKNTLCPTLDKINLMNPFLSLYIEESNKP